MSEARRLPADAARLRRYLASKYGYAPATWFLEPAWICVVLHRLSHAAYRRGRFKTARGWMQLNSLMTGADIQPASDLGPGLLIPSPTGVTISAKAGANLTVLALAGLGGNNPAARDVGAGAGLPVLGNDVRVGQFTGIQGAITVGDGALFYAGAGAVVNVAAGACMVPEAAPIAGPAPEALPPHPPAPPCAHGSWGVSWADWQADIDHTVREMMRLAPPGQSMPRRASVVLTNPLLALLVYRISHFLQCRGWGFAARLLAGVNVLVHKLTIPPEACLGGGVLMPHLAGVVLHGRAGRNLALFANAVCSCAEDARCIAPDQAPVLGNDVMVGGHSGVFGPVRLGDRVQLGPKVQVAQHVAADLQAWDPHARGTTACAAPPKLVSQVQPLRAREKRPWREGWRRLRRDAARWRAQRGGRGAPVFPGLVCVALFRASHALQGCGWRGAARCCAVLNGFLTGADISPGCEIGGGLLLAHPAGVALHGCAGEDLTVMASAGFGALLRDGGLVTLADAPRLGDRVRIAHHAGVFGPISVGDDVAILPGCIVHEPVSAAVTMRPRGLRIRDRRRIARARAAHPRSGSVS